MHITLFDILMFVFTILIAAGVVRSIKAKNKFAVGFGLISLAVFLFADALIIYYATQGS
jgi:hypothetical protein